MLHPRLIDNLLTLPSVGQQTAWLRADKLLTADGLSTLLDTAERLVGANPDQAYKLVQLCEYACLSANLFTILPRATYLRAQLHAIKGEFAIAQNFIETARSGYENLGMTLDALRTNVGLMRVLGETGRYVEALNTGQNALVQIGAVAGQSGAMEPTDYRAVAAMLLQNCGFCYEQIGRYEEALAAYAAAEARYQTLDMTEQQAHIIENRGAVLMAQGRVQDALAAFSYAQQIYAQAGLDFYQAQTLINIGEAHLLLSNYMPGLQAFEQAARLFATLGDTVDHHILLRHTGDAYLSLNLYAEALDAYGRAKAGLQAAGLTLHYALTLWGLGVTQIARNQLGEAQQSLAAAAEILADLDNRPLLSALLLEQSRLLEATEGIPAAYPLAQQALALVEGSNWTVQKI